MSSELKSKAAAELLRRKTCQEDLLAWATFLGAERNEVPAKHHKILLQKLQELTDGKLVSSKTGEKVTNLMILMPPGAAKSRYTSVIYPTWFLQRCKMVRNCTTPRILACSYNANLIEGFSRDCRNTVELHENTLGYALRQDSRSVEKWATTQGGEYKCAGVGAGIAGYRADAGVIDDYLGTQEDADSKLVRDKQWSWYWSDFWCRLKPGAIQIIIANRRHEDDLVGRLLEKEEDKWEVLSFPFFAEDDDDLLGRKVGERLWPEWFTEEMAQTIRSYPPRILAGLYQQRPAAEDGNYFTAAMLDEYTMDEYDKLMSLKPAIYGAGDWAVSETKGSNKTCFGPSAMDDRGTLYILPDIFWKMSGPEETLKNFISFLKRRDPIQFWSESGQISKSWGPFLREQMREAEVYNYITEVVPAKDKEVRAQSIRGRMSLNRVRFPGFASWWPQARHQLLTFPGGKEDDFVDFIAHLGMGINSIMRPTLPAKVPDAMPSTNLTLGWLKKHQKRALREMQPRPHDR